MRTIRWYVTIQLFTLLSALGLHRAAEAWSHRSGLYHALRRLDLDSSR
jgi:hypothetical protein